MNITLKRQLVTNCGVISTLEIDKFTLYTLEKFDYMEPDGDYKLEMRGDRIAFGKRGEFSMDVHAEMRNPGCTIGTGFQYGRFDLSGKGDAYSILNKVFAAMFDKGEAITLKITSNGGYHIPKITKAPVDSRQEELDAEREEALKRLAPQPEDETAALVDAIAERVMDKLDEEDLEDELEDEDRDPPKVV